MASRKILKPGFETELSRFGARVIISAVFSKLITGLAVIPRKIFNESL
jgi:hypothetical protein